MAAPLLSGAVLPSGRYQLAYQVAAYFCGRGVALPEPPFPGEVRLSFGLGDAPQTMYRCWSRPPAT